MKPTNIETINNVLAIAWEDGQESYVAFEQLRRRCPCAACQGETNVLSRVAPPPQSFTAASFELQRWEYVGGYAIQPHWADGHASGIYSFPYLRQLGDSAPGSET